MATVIDSLIVTLGLDSKDVDAKAPGVRKKLQDLEKDADKAEKSTAKFGKELKRAGTALASFLAVVGGTQAIRSFVRDTVEANTQLHFLSQNLGMTVRSLFSLGAAGQQIGIGKNALQSLAAMFREVPGQLQAGQQPPVIRLLARAGINWLGSPQEQMIGLARWFQSMPPNVALGLGTSYGLSYDQMTFLLQGAQKVSAQLQQVGVWSPTGKQAAQFTEMKRQIVDLGLQWAKVGYDLLSIVAPALERVIGFFREIGAWAQRHEKIVAIIAGVATALGAIGALAGIIGGVAIAWSALTAAIAAAWPVLAVIGVVSALAAAILLLWDDYKVWSEGGKSLFNWSEFTKDIKEAADEIKGLAKGFEDAYAAWQKFMHRKDTQAVAGVITGSSGYDLGSSLREKFDAFVARHTGGMGMADLIASREGFYARGKTPNIPQKAHNPGDIEYGDFAKAHGATGYVIAKGGKKIATFPDDKTGFDALHALLGTKGYAGLSPDQILSRWQTGSANARANADMASTRGNVSHSTDNSRTTHIGTVTIQNPSGSSAITPGMARGMDWITLLSQANAGLL